MTNKREEYVASIQKDYPHLHRWFIDMCLDIYEHDSDWFKKQKSRFDKLKKKKQAEGQEIQTAYKNIEFGEPDTVIKVDFN